MVECASVWAVCKLKFGAWRAAARRVKEEARVSACDWRSVKVARVSFVGVGWFVVFVRRVHTRCDESTISIDQH